MKETDALQAVAARESGRAAYSPETGVKFSASDNVFVKSALEVNFTHRNPPGIGNRFVAGVRPTRAIINCPVIAQPNLPAQ